MDATHGPMDGMWNRCRGSASGPPMDLPGRSSVSGGRVGPRSRHRSRWVDIGRRTFVRGLMLVGCLLTTTPGCRSFAAPPGSVSGGATPAAGGAGEVAAVNRGEDQVGTTTDQEAPGDPEPPDGSSWLDSTRESAERVVGLVTGREPQDVDRARELYREGDAMFRRARTLPPGEAGRCSRKPPSVSATRVRRHLVRRSARTGCLCTPRASSSPIS